MCYLLSADAYVTFRQLFRYYYFDLDLKYIFLKHESEFDVSLTKRNRANIKKVSDLLAIWMIVANAQNVVDKASPLENRIRCDFNYRLPTTEQLAKDYLNSGSCNYQWLGAAEISKQLIVKALDWYLSQSMDTQSDTPICKLIEEVNGKYAVKIVKQMPGSFQIPNVY